jgi:hypothetical protein
MDDLDGMFPFFALLGLTLFIFVLGISVKTRIARDSVTNSAGISTVFILLLALVLAFFSTFMPFLAAFPAVCFLIRGLQALSRSGRDVLNRDGGIVIILVGLAWVALTVLQAALLAWGKTVAGAPIRIDIVVTVPVMAVVSYFGWTIQWALPVQRLSPSSPKPVPYRRPGPNPSQRA